MPYFRKKPVVIEAIQWLGDNITEVLTLEPNRTLTLDEHDQLHITTLEGMMTANIGDWIIKGIKGECYPCKPDIFAATYDLVEDTTND